MRALLIGILSILSLNKMRRKRLSVANKEELQGNFEDKTTPIVTRYENTSGVTSIVRDITDCKKMEEQSQEIGKFLNAYKGD